MPLSAREVIMDLSTRVYYDAQEKVIMVDYTNLQLTVPILKEFYDSIIKTAQGLPEKPYVLINFQNAQMMDGGREYFVQRYGEIMKVIKAFVRYNVNVFITRITLQAEDITQAKKADTFATKEEALQAIREKRV